MRSRKLNVWNACSLGYYITEMIRDVLANYIIYLSGMVPGILCAGIGIAAVVTAIARLVGVPLAGLIARMPRSISLVMRAILFLFILPAPTLTGILVRRIYEWDAPVILLVRNALTMLRPVTVASGVGAGIVSFPILVLFTAAALRRVDPETVLAAQTLGMKNSVIHRKVVLPQARSGIVNGTVLCCVRALGESMATAAALADPDMWTGDLLSVLISSIDSGAYACACLYVAGWLLVGGLVLLLYHLLLRRRAGKHRARK